MLALEPLLLQVFCPSSPLAVVATPDMFAYPLGVKQVVVMLLKKMRPRGAFGHMPAPAGL